MTDARWQDMKRYLLILGLVCGAVCAGCQASAEVTTTTAAPAPVQNIISTEAAIKDITGARCARALSCDDVGQDRAWKDMDDCNVDVRRTTRDYIAGQSCAYGIDPGKLRLCIDAIREEHCGAPREMGEQLTTCAETKLCL